MGDTQARPHAFRDIAVERGLVLFRNQRNEPTEREARDLLAQIEKIQANNPEQIKRIRGLQMDRTRGRLAVGLSVFGDHQELQPQAEAWSGELNDDPMAVSWAIEH